MALDLALHLATRGNDVHILTMHFGALARRERSSGVTIRRIRCGRRRADSAQLGSMIRFVIGARWAAGRLLARGAFDIVHAHAIVPDGAAASSAARRHRIPMVITAHGSDVPEYDPRRYSGVHRVLAPAWRRIVARADLLVAPSKFLRDLIHERAPSARIEIIPNGIETDQFAPKAKEESFLIVSRLIARKNLDRFFEALRHVDDPQEVNVVGDGPELARLQELAAGTHHRVVFHGWLAHGSARWRELFERSRFFVLPSAGENFPMTLLEAQLAGMTVLSSPIAGNREVLGDEAVYFDDLTAEAMARTVNAVLRWDANTLGALGSAARDRVMRNFSWGMITGRYLARFEDLLEDSNRA